MNADQGDNEPPTAMAPMGGDEELQRKYEQLRFEPHGSVGAMRVLVEDVEIIAVSHPLRGVVLLVSHSSPRSLAHFEVDVPVEATVSQIAQALHAAYLQVHPESKSV